jgi:F420-dependent oxidoreductase-like protein
LKLGITLAWPGDAAGIGPEVERVARVADEGGIDSIWTADHLFQIPVTGLPREAPMLEAYATLAYVAGITTRITLGPLVTCVMYRHPGMVVKAATTLDVLSGGRLVLGVGVGWDAEEADGLGLPFAPLAERYERLEEWLRIAHQMWCGDEAPVAGRHYRLGRPLNSPTSLQRPRPPILVGGGGEQRTLPLVARYADACNLFDLDPPFAVDLRHKLDVLHGHCDAIGRDPAEIEVTTVTGFDLGPDRGAGLRRLVARLERLAAIGVGHAIVMGPTFDWGEDLAALLSIVDDVHAIDPAPTPADRR